MPLIAIIALAFAIGSGIGGTAAYRLQQSKVLAMELKIQEANTQALAILNMAKTKVHEAELQAIRTNEELDKANDVHIQTINHYYDALHAELAKRVHDDKACVSNTMPESGGTGKSKASSSKTRFSEKYVRFLENQLKQASEASNYAAEAGQFINNKCNIK